MKNILINLKEWGGIVISLLGSCFTLFVYLTHDKKLKQLTLAKEEYEKEIRNSARVTAVLCREDGRKCLCVKNEGNAKAKNVQVALSPDVRNMPRQFPFPMDLESGQAVNISITTSIGGPKVISVELKWNDDYHKDDTQKRNFNMPLFS